MGWLIWIFVILFGFLAFGLGSDVDCSTSPGGTEECPARRVTVATAVIQPPDGREWEEVSVGEIQGVILPERAASSLLFGTYPDLEYDDYWTPTLTDVEAAEAAIAAEQGQLDHMRQYAGFVENGERKVFVNGLCDAFGTDWTSERILVDDGGDCFFTAVFNVDQSELETFRFNGEG